MNRRIIKAILQKKFNEWVNSIKDNYVQNAVRKNSIITGGSIVSLLLKEKVSAEKKELETYLAAQVTCPKCGHKFVP